MDFNSKIPFDGEVYDLSNGEIHTRAEFVETKGEDGAPGRIAWRLYDRHGKGILLTQLEMVTLCLLTKNYLNKDNLEQ